jgi:hypothetical protein
MLRCSRGLFTYTRRDRDTVADHVAGDGVRRLPHGEARTAEAVARRRIGAHPDHGVERRHADLGVERRQSTRLKGAIEGVGPLLLLRRSAGEYRDAVVSWAKASWRVVSRAAWSESAVKPVRISLVCARARRMP